MLQVHNPGIWEKKAYIIKHAYQKKHSDEWFKQAHTQSVKTSQEENYKLQWKLVDTFVIDVCMYYIARKQLAAKVECNDEKWFCGVFP